MLTRILCLIIGYIFGLFQAGYIIGRLNHIDIRKHGSGNAGTTNSLRVLGKKAALLTLIGDCGKAILCTIIVYFVFNNTSPNISKVLVLYAGLGVILGHNYPFYLKFKGGKGVAATVGVLWVFDYRIAIISCIAFFTCIYITRYVSLGSIALAITFFVTTVIFGVRGCYKTNDNLTEIYVLAFIMLIMIVFTHRANIKRLISGKEFKIGEKK